MNIDFLCHKMINMSLSDELKKGSHELTRVLACKPLKDELDKFGITKTLKSYYIYPTFISDIALLKLVITNNIIM